MVKEWFWYDPNRRLHDKRVTRCLAMGDRTPYAFVKIILHNVVRLASPSERRPHRRVYRWFTRISSTTLPQRIFSLDYRRCLHWKLFFQRGQARRAELSTEFVFQTRSQARNAEIFRVFRRVKTIDTLPLKALSRAELVTQKLTQKYELSHDLEML